MRPPPARPRRRSSARWPRGTRLVLAGGERHERILPVARFTARQRGDLAALNAGHHHQVRRRQQAHRARQLVRDAGIVEVGEQQHQGAVLEQRAHTHRRGGRIGFGRLH